MADPTILRDPADESFARNSKWARKADTYITELPPEQEGEFRKWVKENKVPFDPSSKADYDMRGFWLALKRGDPRASTAVNPNDKMMHFPDVWKTPYHRSFSAESQWATAQAPVWNEKDQLVTPDGSVVYDEREEARRKR